MRTSSDTSIIFEGSSTLIGFNLSADFVAEHEFGIDRLKSHLTRDSKAYGLSGRRIRQTDSVRYNGSDLLVIMDSKWAMQHYEDKDCNWNLSDYGSDSCGLKSSWGDNGLIIQALTAESQEYLRQLHQAILKKKVAIVYKYKFGFYRGGLALVIIDRVPKNLADDLYQSDKNEAALVRARKRLRIDSVLRERGLTYWTSVDWSKNHNLKTKFKIVFHVNYSFVSGWYTHEELESWLKSESGRLADDTRKNMAETKSKLENAWENVFCAEF
jgi:hypothetical protein